MKKAAIYKLGTLDYAGAEAMNTICTNLLFAGKQFRKIVITSCNASEGKSFMAMRIFQNLTRRGKRVMLVDADLRRSYLTKKYDIRLQGEPLGLAHYLAGQCEIQDVEYMTNIPGGYIIPAGRDVASPLPLLDSQIFTDMLDRLAEQYDLVLVDAPPVGLVVDAASIAKRCDGAVFVIEYNSTRRRALADAYRQIEQSGCPVVGYILNSVTFDTLSSKRYYNRSYYTSYTSGYYRRYRKRG